MVDLSEAVAATGDLSAAAAAAAAVVATGGGTGTGTGMTVGMTSHPPPHFFLGHQVVQQVVVALGHRAR